MWHIHYSVNASSVPTPRIQSKELAYEKVCSKGRPGTCRGIPTSKTQRKSVEEEVKAAKEYGQVAGDDAGEGHRST